jgi:lactate 2-monooxygenase
LFIFVCFYPGRRKSHRDGCGRHRRLQPRSDSSCPAKDLLYLPEFELLGGRQIDGAIASLYALDKICQSPTVSAAQKSGKLTVLFDSGIRTGSDIIKALALGAQGVLRAFKFFYYGLIVVLMINFAVTVGRPYMYGLAIGGEKGVEQVLRSTLADMEITMGLAGYKNVGEIQGKRDEIIIKMDIWEDNLSW